MSQAETAPSVVDVEQQKEFAIHKGASSQQNSLEEPAHVEQN